MRLLGAMLIASSLIVTGCKSGDKKSPFAGRDRNNPFWADDQPGSLTPAKRNDPLVPASHAESEGMLAGRVIDASGRPAANSFVQVSLAQQDNAKPVGVTTDAQGYFLIPGLKAGRTYTLAARSDEGGRVLAGVIQTRPPNTRLVLPIREGNVSSITPPPQPHPGEVGPFAKPDKDKKESPTNSLPPPDPVNDPLAPHNQDQSWRPGGNPPASRVAPPPRPSPFNNNPSRIENVADDPNRPRDPKVNIPNPNGSDTRNRISPAPPPPRPVTSPDATLGPTPRSESSNPKLNFTLYDPQGEAWQFRYASGRLVLLDFWKTNCRPCIQAMPELKDLAKVYGGSGLEVVGVACEDGGTHDDQVAAVSRMANQQRLNYRVVLDNDRREVERLFGVKAYPTLVLLDRQGNVLENLRGATPENMQRLENAIKRGLTRK